jgi:hypothetical protein
VTPSRSSHMDNPPTTNIHTIVKAQIVFLLSTLTEDNFERNQVEIRSVCLLFFLIMSSNFFTDRSRAALGATWNRHLSSFYSSPYRSFSISFGFSAIPFPLRHIYLFNISIIGSGNSTPCSRPISC